MSKIFFTFLSKRTSRLGFLVYIVCEWFAGLCVFVSVCVRYPKIQRWKRYFFCYGRRTVARTVCPRVLECGVYRICILHGCVYNGISVWKNEEAVLCDGMIVWIIIDWCGGSLVNGSTLYSLLWEGVSMKKRVRIIIPSESGKYDSWFDLRSQTRGNVLSINTPHTLSQRGGDTTSSVPDTSDLKS